MKISIRAYLGRGGKQQNLIDCVRNIERRLNADYPDLLRKAALLPATGMAKIVRSDRQVWVWVKPAASIIYQGVEWDATKIHHKSTSVAIACLAAASGGSAAIPKSELESNRGGATRALKYLF